MEELGRPPPCSFGHSHDSPFSVSVPAGPDPAEGPKGLFRLGPRRATTRPVWGLPLIDHDIGAVVVAERESAVGVFTERDMTRRILDDEELLSREMREVMSAPVTTVGPDDEVVFIFRLMVEKEIRRLPVVEDGRLVGIVTERDLLRWVDAVATA